MVKRGVDVVLAAFLLLCALPILLVVALAIRMSSPGPIFFRQTRMGRGVQRFRIWKLRTMAHNRPGLAYTLGADPRITRFGHWLRRTKIDELPQLWNVLRGEMSLVGPRPVIPELVMEFNVAYSELLRVRPGLTDPASLKYCQESRLLAAFADPMDCFKRVVTPDKLRLSLEYMQRANLWTDLKTLAMTVLICFVPSMSRRYGELPELQPVGQAEPEPTMAILSFPRTESLLPPEPAYAAGMVDEVSPSAGIPWFLLQPPLQRLQSTLTGPRGRGSRL